MELSTGVVEYREGGESPVFRTSYSESVLWTTNCPLLCFRPTVSQDSSYFLLDSACIFILNKILT
jgi:hypothetical protein